MAVFRWKANNGKVQVSLKCLRYIISGAGLNLLLSRLIKIFLLSIFKVAFTIKQAAVSQRYHELS